MGGLEGCAKEPLGASRGLIKIATKANSGRLAPKGFMKRRGPGKVCMAYFGLIN